MLTFLDVPVAETGLTVVLLSNGLLMLERSATFVTTYDYSPDGITGFFDTDGFTLLQAGYGMNETQEYEYGVAYPYKELPTLKAWLVQQNLQLPVAQT